MAVDKRELLLDLLARDRSKQATDSFSKNMGGAADAADDATEATERLSKAAKENTADIAKLDREIGLAEKELESLARAFARTDDAAERLDLSKVVRKLEADLKRLNKNKGVLEELLPTPAAIAGPAAAVGRSAMKSIGEGLASAGASVATKAGASVGPVVGGAIAAAAGPVLVSSLASVLAAGAGAGAIGAGIALAVARDDKLQAAGTAAGERFMRGLGKAATGSFRGPILQSLGILTDAGDRLNESLGKTFAELGDDVVPFTRKIVGAGEAVTGSLLKAARESGPAVDGLGDAVTLVGDGVAVFIDTLADGGPQAADNLRLIAGATGDLLKYTGLTLKSLNDLANNPMITGPLLPLLRKHYADAAKESDNLKGSTQALIPPMSEAEKAARGQTVALAGLSKEMRSQADPVFALREAQNKLADAQKASTEAVAKHGPKSREAREATRNLATAAIDLQGRVGALGRSFDGKLTPAMRSTLVAAGLTKAQIDAVEKEFGAAKRAGDRYSKTYAATTKVYGAKTARAALYSVKDIADDIPRAVTIAMRITGVSNVSKAAAAVKKQYRERGGPVRKGEAYVVGEKRPEVFVPDRDGQIIPSIEQFTGGASQRMSRSGGTGGVQQLVLSVGPGGNAALQALLQALLPYLRTEVRTTGRGSVQTLLGVKGAG